jgi:tryptophanyl-tRNA synthetase
MRIVSGIQPTGDLHLGNYIGAIKRWTALQHQAECFIFLADLHSMSEYIPAEKRRASVQEMAAALIACGIDPARAVLFNQARVPAHAELCWLLNGIARIGWLNRMTQWKDKAGKNRESASVALFDYPVLQAADVLLYQATHVPVGEDQKQHIELIRDIVLKFHNDYDCDVFALPEPLIGKFGARIMSLRDGQAKMSKSDPSDMSRINLTDDADLVSQKVRKARTDAEPLPESWVGLEGRPEAKNLVTIYAALSDETPEAVLARFAGQGFGAFKPALAELTVETLRPIKARLDELREDQRELDSILERGAEKAVAAAAPTLAAAYEAVGLRHGG